MQGTARVTSSNGAEMPASLVLWDGVFLGWDPSNLRDLHVVLRRLAL